MSKKNTSTITFRIDESFDEHLRKIAQEQKISLNTLANQIFGNNSDLVENMEKYGVIKMSKKVLKMFLDKTVVKELKLLVLNAGAKEPVELLLFNWTELNYENDTMFI